jgi:LAO/AO transport system kinase
MVELSADSNAFIRPSPSAGSLGGVARKTRETILLCEAAGFDVIFVETVGVGQSETAVHSMVDFFLLLMLAGAGDELQGIKRGIIEMADAIFINKADGENLVRATAAQAEYRNALHLFPPASSGWTPMAGICSAKTKMGIDTIWNTILSHRHALTDSGYFYKKRMEQDRHTLFETIEEGLKNHFYSDPGISGSLKDVVNRIDLGLISPYQAAQKLLETWCTHPNSMKKRGDFPV